MFKLRDQVRMVSGESSYLFKPHSSSVICTVIQLGDRDLYKSFKVEWVNERGDLTNDSFNPRDFALVILSLKDLTSVIDPEGSWLTDAILDKVNNK